MWKGKKHQLDSGEDENEDASDESSATQGESSESVSDDEWAKAPKKGKGKQDC